MGLEHKILLIVSIIITSMLANFPPLLPVLLVHAGTQVPCYFIFGDSLVDNGNNNNLKTTAKANYHPYGIDFPDGPTGRFCNSYNIADIIAQYLGFNESAPPFATAKGREILKGVNYGSGGAGILDETGRNLGARISMNMQLQNHRVTISRITKLLKSEEAAANYLSKCIYSVGMGNNDYINNYLMPSEYRTSSLFTPSQFASYLIGKLYKQLKILYQMKAKKVILFGPGIIGCTPAKMAIYGINRYACVNFINDYVQLFNDGFKPLVNKLNRKLNGSNFTFIDVIQLSSRSTSAYGLTVTNTPCCNVSSNGMCIPNSFPCNNRNIYAFYDGFHPTKISNVLLGAGAYYAKNGTYAYPYGIQTLVG